MPQTENFSIQTRSSSKIKELTESNSRELGIDLKNVLNQQSVIGSILQTTQPISALKFKSSGISRPRSVSFSTPEFRDALKSPEGSSPESPMRLRSHTSEAGSPTIEQAILMGRDSPGSDAGYGSFQSDSLRKDADTDSMSPASQPADRSYSPGEPRPTLATLAAEADIAVVQAAQNLLDLKERQAAIYDELNHSSKAKSDGGILSALLSATQGSKSTDNQLFQPREMPSRIFRDPFVDTEVRNTYDNDYNKTRDPLALERAARQYRQAAHLSEAKATWTGQLMPKHQAGRNSSYSSKIFLGGVPWDITEMALIQAFNKFGPVRVEWPGRENNPTPKGFLYIAFEDEVRVKDLLGQCAQDFSNGGSYYYKIESEKRGVKDIQIIPWLVDDSTYIGYASPQLDPKKTVFVGALHGMMNAQSLALIFNDLFGNVVFAGLDTDKYKYPIGSGRVTFSSTKSFRKAVNSAFIEIKTPRFQKKIQVDPYLEDAICSLCQMKQGPYFCREEKCFDYFCRGCWERIHQHYPQHKPLMRNIRGLTRARLQDLVPECYTTNYGYPGRNETKIDLWGEYDQDKRFELDNWKYNTVDRNQFSRRDNRVGGGGGQFNQQVDRPADAWRDLPDSGAPWRTQEKEPSWMSAGNSEFTWDDDQSKLSAVFENTMNLGVGEKSCGLKPFFDEQPPVFKSLRDTGFNSFRSSLDDRSYRDAVSFSSAATGITGSSSSKFADRFLNIGKEPNTTSSCSGMTTDRFGFPVFIPASDRN